MKNLGRSKKKTKSKQKKHLEKRFSSNEIFLASMIELVIPCLPFNHEKENELFNKLLRERSGNFDDREIALEFAKKSDGFFQNCGFT